MYQFLDANSSILSADSSIISGVIQRPTVDIGSVLSAVPVSFSGSPSVSGAVTIIGTPSISGTVNIGNQSGSVVSFQGGTQITSVIGVVGDGTARTAGDKGMYTLGLRNDSLSSIVSGTGQYAPQTVGAAGEAVTANAPFSNWVQGVASCFTGVIQPVISAGGSSIFTYITSGQVANASANNVYLTFYGAASSVVGFLPVPANSGALPIMPNAWKTNANGAFSASVSGVASVFLSFQGFTSKT